MIDLRSDTVTRPTPGMRHAMADAEVGDAVIDIDPTVQRLERFTAELLGKEDAVYMPSGTMTNQIGLRVHCGRDSEFLCEADCHIYHYEQGAFAQLSGLVARTVAGDQGVMRLAQLQGLIRPLNDHLVRTRLVCYENTHNRWGGKIIPQDEIVRVANWARSSGLAMHLDGARLWNAAIALGLSERELAEPFDTVSVCFSKGLGAPVGSALAGPADLMAEARRGRKLFGGGMRQAGVIAAGALYAIQHHRTRLAEDHVAARRLAEAFDPFPEFSIRGGSVDTNIVIVDIDPGWGSAPQLAQGLDQLGVRCMAFSPQAIRMVTHLDVTSEQIDSACRAIRQAVETPVATHAG